MDQENSNQEAQSPYLIPGSILAAGVIIALAVMYTSGPKEGAKAPAGSQSPTQTAALGASAEAQALLEDPDDGRLLGNPNAKVSFVEFGDFQCPFCGRFYQTTEKQLIEKYVKTGQVKFIWRDFAFLGQESFDAAQAARCAGEQSRFWEYHDTLFENQRGENQGAFSVAILKNFAVKLGLNANAFNACLDSEKYLAEVQKESELGRDLGVTGTPSSFINGRQVTGALPFASFEAIILEALNQ